MNKSTCLDTVCWNAEGLVPVIAQEVNTRHVLMLAWMNREALQQTVDRGVAVYWSRSRQRLWQKGETSGNTQHVKGIYLDCDGDTLLLEVTQTGNTACHTGRERCFFNRLEKNRWQISLPIQNKPPSAG